MKSIIVTFITSIIVTLTASAAVQVLIETSIAKKNADGAKELLSKPSVIVESGKQAFIKLGKIEYAITPTVLPNGTVDIETVITEHDGKKAVVLAKPKVIVELGEEGEITSEQLSLTLRPTLKK